MDKSDELFELMTKMYSEIQEMKYDISGVKGDITSMKGDITGMKGDITSLKKDVNKNSLLLEKVASNVKLLAEGQEAFREQIGSI